MKEFEPNIVAYCCEYCGYAAADLAGSMRISYPANVTNEAAGVVTEAVTGAAGMVTKEAKTPEMANPKIETGAT